MKTDSSQLVAHIPTELSFIACSVQAAARLKRYTIYILGERDGAYLTGDAYDDFCTKQVHLFGDMVFIFIPWIIKRFVIRMLSVINLERLTVHSNTPFAVRYQKIFNQ